MNNLPRPISLDDWEVALTEISVPFMFNNVKKDSCFLVLTKGAKRMYTYPIQTGCYRSTKELIKFLNDVLRVRGITFLMYGKK